MPFATNFLNSVKNFLDENHTPAKVSQALTILYLMLAAHIIKAGILDFEIFQSAAKGTATLLETGLYIGFFSLPPIILFYLIQKIQNKSILARNVFTFIALFFLTMSVLLSAYPIFAHKICVSKNLLDVFFYIMLIPAKLDAAFALLGIYDLFHKDSQAWFQQSKIKQTIPNHV